MRYTTSSSILIIQYINDKNAGIRCVSAKNGYAIPGLCRNGDELSLLVRYSK